MMDRTEEILALADVFRKVQNTKKWDLNISTCRQLAAHLRDYAKVYGAIEKIDKVLWEHRHTKDGAIRPIMEVVFAALEKDDG